MFPMKFVRKFGSITVGSVLVLTSVACTTTPSVVQNYVTNVQTQSFMKGSDQWIEIAATLNSGGFAMAGVEIPVINPNIPGLTYGKFSLLPTSCGTNCNGGQLTLDLNLSQVSGLPPVKPLLPNNTPLPIAGIPSSGVITVPVGDTGARIYLAINNGSVMVGTAIPFSAMDPASHYVPGTNIFIPVTVANVHLSAGLFVGSQPSTTGIGLFVDVSNLVPTTPLLSEILTSSEFTSSRGANPSKGLSFRQVKPSSTKETQLGWILYNLSRQGVVLEVK